MLLVLVLGALNYPPFEEVDFYHNTIEIANR